MSEQQPHQQALSKRLRCWQAQVNATSSDWIKPLFFRDEQAPFAIADAQDRAFVWIKPLSELNAVNRHRQTLLNQLTWLLAYLDFQNPVIPDSTLSVLNQFCASEPIDLARQQPWSANGWTAACQTADSAIHWLDQWARKMQINREIVKCYATFAELACEQLLHIDQITVQSNGKTITCILTGVSTSLPNHSAEFWIPDWQLAMSHLLVFNYIDENRLQISLTLPVRMLAKSEHQQALRSVIVCQTAKRAEAQSATLPIAV